MDENSHYHEIQRLSNEILSDRSLPNQNYSQSVVKVMQEKIDFFKSNSGKNSIDYNAISGQVTIQNGKQQILCQRYADYYSDCQCLWRGQKKALECGMDGFLSKPIVIEELLSTLQKNLYECLWRDIISQITDIEEMKENGNHPLTSPNLIYYNIYRMSKKPIRFLHIYKQPDFK